MKKKLKLMPRRKVITAQWLVDNEACSGQVDLFRQTFGQSVRITPATLTKARRVRLNLRWVVDRLVGGHADRSMNELNELTCLACQNAKRPARTLLLEAARG